MDYGKTLHLPETEFPMRGNLPQARTRNLKIGRQQNLRKTFELRKDANLSSCMMASIRKW